MEDTSAHCMSMSTVSSYCINKHIWPQFINSSLTFHHGPSLTFTIYKFCVRTLIHYCIKIKACLEYMFIMYTFKWPFLLAVKTL